MQDTREGTSRGTNTGGEPGQQKGPGCITTLLQPECQAAAPRRSPPKNITLTHQDCLKCAFGGPVGIIREGENGTVSEFCSNPSEGPASPACGEAANSLRISLGESGTLVAALTSPDSLCCY